MLFKFNISLIDAFILMYYVIYNDNVIKKIIESTIKEESWYPTTVLPLMIISVLEVIKNDPMGKIT